MNVSKPHRAIDVDLAIQPFQCMAFPKIDGHRGVFLKGSVTTRELKPFRNSKVTDYFSNPLFTGFDGEFVAGDPIAKGVCGKTTSLVSSYHYNTDGGLPTWFLFDWVDEHTWMMPYIKRYRTLAEYVAGLNNPLLQIVPHATMVRNQEEALAAHDCFVSMGYEGTVFRLLDAPHKNGYCTPRQSYFTRLKDMVDEEALIVGFVEAQENTNIATRNELGYISRSSAKDGLVGKGMVGSLIIKRADGTETPCGPGELTHDQRIEMWHNQEAYLNTMITFRYMPYGTLRAPRFPRYVSPRKDNTEKLAQLENLI
jgi:DNA ligase-1